MKRWLSAILALLFTFFAVACSGGGDTDPRSDTEPPSDLSTDDESPKLVSKIKKFTKN